MTPEEIVRSANRRLAEEETKVKAARQEVDVLKQMLARKRDNTDSVSLDNDMLWRMVDEERWNTTVAIQEVEALRVEIGMMRGHLAELQSRQHGMALQLE